MLAHLLQHEGHELAGTEDEEEEVRQRRDIGHIQVRQVEAPLQHTAEFLREWEGNLCHDEPCEEGIDKAVHEHLWDHHLQVALHHVGDHARIAILEGLDGVDARLRLLQEVTTGLLVAKHVSVKFKKESSGCDCMRGRGRVRGRGRRRSEKSSLSLHSLFLTIYTNTNTNTKCEYTSSIVFTFEQQRPWQG